MFRWGEILVDIRISQARYTTKMLTADSSCRMLTALARDAAWSDSGGEYHFGTLTQGRKRNFPQNYSMPSVLSWWSDRDALNVGLWLCVSRCASRSPWGYSPQHFFSRHCSSSRASDQNHSKWSIVPHMSNNEDGAHHIFSCASDRSSNPAWCEVDRSLG